MGVLTIMAQAVILISSYQADTTQEQNQRRLVSSMEANNIDFITVDGALPDQKVHYKLVPTTELS